MCQLIYFYILTFYKIQIFLKRFVQFFENLSATECKSRFSRSTTRYSLLTGTSIKIKGIINSGVFGMDWIGDNSFGENVINEKYIKR